LFKNWSAKLSLVKVKLALTYVIILLTDFSFIFAKMIVGINICGAVKENGERPGDLIINYFTRIAIKHPEHAFVFITDGPVENLIEKTKNTSIIIVEPRPKRTLFWKFWYNYKLESIVRKQQIAVLIYPDPICSLRSKTPQFLLINELPFLHGGSMPKTYFRFYKKHTLQFLQKAKRIATVSDFLKKEIADKYKIDEQQLDIIYSSIDKRYMPVPFDKKEQTKEKYAEGKEYFLYAGEINADKNLIVLLKAFSFFKKRQKSNMQLLILSESLNSGYFSTSLKTYKYRHEVKLLLDLPVEEQAVITASAYSFVYPSLYEPFPKKIIEALQCEVPVIANHMDVVIEICADAVLYTNTNNFEEIADKMMLLFKDEKKRNEFILKSSKQALQYSLDKTADLLWQSIVKTTAV